MKTRSQIQNILFITLCVFAITSCNKEKKFKTEEEKEHQLAVEHHIKSITEFRSAFLGDVPQQEIRSHELFFDENGNKIKEIDYTSENDKGTVVSYEYDKQGHLVSSNATNPDGSFLFKTTRNYYADGNRKELYFYLPDGIYKYRNTAAYDEKGNLISLKWYWPTGFKAENKYTYTDSRLSEDSEYDPEGKFLYKWIYTYDTRDNLTEAIQYYPNNLINSKVIYVYNNKNLLIKQDNFLGEFTQTSTVFEYDKKNLLSKKSDYSASGKISTSFRYAYEFY